MTAAESHVRQDISLVQTFAYVHKVVSTFHQKIHINFIQWKKVKCHDTCHRDRLLPLVPNDPTQEAQTFLFPPAVVEDLPVNRKL